MQDLIAKYGPDTSLAATKALARGMVTEIRANQTELKKVLSPTQWTLHQQHKAERLAMTQTEFMASDLNLSRQQILDVQRINLAAANKLVPALDKPLGAAKPMPQALMEAAKPVLDERDVALREVLTLDQWKMAQLKRRALHELFVTEATASPNPLPPRSRPHQSPNESGSLRPNPVSRGALPFVIRPNRKFVMPWSIPTRAERDRFRSPS